MVAGAIEPALIVESVGVDDERPSLPASDRLPHPRIDLRRTGVLQINVADGAGILVRDEERRVALEDLKRKRHVCRARNSRQVALDLGIARQPVVLILFLLRLGFRRVRNGPAHDHTHAARNGSDGPEREHLSGGHGNDGTRAHRQRRACHVRLEVVVGGIQGLPNPVQIGLAIRRAWDPGAGPGPPSGWRRKTRPPPPPRRRARPTHLEAYWHLTTRPDRRDCCTALVDCQGRLAENKPRSPTSGGTPGITDIEVLAGLACGSAQRTTTCGRAAMITGELRQAEGNGTALALVGDPRWDSFAPLARRRGSQRQCADFVFLPRRPVSSLLIPPARVKSRA